jgi:AcrR family transcriptional regulator
MIRFMPKTSLENPGAHPARTPGSAASGRDLRQDILDTARALIDEEGVAALSMREVARRAGVTHQAPYHHFGDRESILAELVTQGFDELARRLAAANNLAPSAGKRAALLASGEAYIGFALSHPGVFRIMFRPDLCDPMRFPDLRQAGARAHAELERLVRIVHGNRLSAALASIYWAYVHGMACLMIDGPLAMQLATDKSRQTHLREVGRKFADLMLSLT